MDENKNICDYCGKPGAVNKVDLKTAKCNVLNITETVSLCPKCAGKLLVVRQKAEIDFYKKIKSKRRDRERLSRKNVQTLDDYEKAYIKALNKAQE